MEIKVRGRKATTFLFDMIIKNALTTVLRRENITFTEWVHRQAIDFVKAHANGNPIAPLDKWADDPEFVACPTILEALGFPWDTMAYKDLKRIEEIMIKEKPRIYSARRKKENQR